ncbi:Neuronal tyrosine-phosphorylated phosphoinositide-3-kinase adapter [Trichinella spiralis]|uniref:Neuronal tyrosine-phosphorylated phosphoinositide-3-kinase adapter n=1 Tax=Trichinella spiralis TaxID=6334 RepID=A0ABR3K5G0_TRISP
METHYRQWKMAVQQFSQNIFRQLIDQYRLQANDRTRQLLNAFENFERQLQESAQRLNEDRKQRDDQLNKLQKKYSKWKLPKFQVPNDQKCENAANLLDSTTDEKKNMDELKCEIEQLKLQLNNVSGNLFDIRELLKNANKAVEQQPKRKSSTTKQTKPVPSREISTELSTESEGDSFLNLKFTSIRNNTNENNNSRAVGKKSYSPPRVSFAFDRQRGGKIFNSHNSQLVHAEIDTDHSPTSDKSEQSKSVHKKNNIVKVNNNNNNTSTDTDEEEEESVKSELNSNDSHDDDDESVKKLRSGSYEPATNSKDKKDEDDFLAKLFPDKFGSKLTLNNTTNASSKLSADTKELVTLIGSNQNYTDESDSDFFYS